MLENIQILSVTRNFKRYIGYVSPLSNWPLQFLMNQNSISEPKIMTEPKEKAADAALVKNGSCIGTLKTYCLPLTLLPVDLV